MEALIFTSLIDFRFWEIPLRNVVGTVWLNNKLSNPFTLSLLTDTVLYSTEYGNTVNFKVLDCSEVRVPCGDTLTLFNARFDLIVLFPQSLSKQLVD